MPVLLGEPEQPQIDISAVESRSPAKQRSRMLLAMCLLLVALILVLVRYREFWLTSEPATESQVDAPATPEPATKAHVKSNKMRAAKAAEAARRSGGTTAAAIPLGASAEVTRIVLQPMQVEVLRSGGRHQTIRTRSSAINLDLSKETSDSLPVTAAASAPVAPAAPADRVRLSPATVAAVATPVEPVYPPLAEQMNVQGSVVLQLHVGKDGNIEDLQVVSGPDILADAAREAVRQWHFKPYMRNGSAVETEAKVTVRFSISTP